MCDFIDMVSGALAWNIEVKEQETDLWFDQLSHYTANIMLSSGNYKKSVTLERIKEALYIPVRDREEYERKKKLRERRLTGEKPSRSHSSCSAPADKLKELKEAFNLK